MTTEMRSKALFLLFNHSLTSIQKQDAKKSLKISSIFEMPSELKLCWSNIPPEAPQITPFLQPIKNWLSQKSQKGDYVLIQGDFGACFLIVNFAFKAGLTPVYSTTHREASETKDSNGSIKLTHHFKHRIFRKYEF